MDFNSVEIENFLRKLSDKGLPDKTFLDLAAIFAAPEPTKEQIQSELQRDQMANPHNDGYGKPKRRGHDEIICDLRYRFAHEMLAARGRTLDQLNNIRGSGRI